jgi:Tfp pilus assembly protein FimV
MKQKLPWLFALALLVAVAALFAFNRKQAAELARLQTENQQYQQLGAANDENAKSQDQAKDAELTRLRQDNEDLLRLRNEVRQLKNDNQGLTKQVQTAQAQVQTAQAQIEGAQAQVQALRQTAAQAQAQQATDAAFRARYGLASNASEQEKATACLNNLRQLDGAKQQWALEHSKPANSVPTEADLRPYLKGNALPSCASGGTYTLNQVNMPPTCSIPGHVLR